MLKSLFIAIFGFMGFGAFCLANSHNSAAAKADSNPIKKVVREMARSNVYEIINMDASAQTNSAQSGRYQQLLKTATTQQLINLAKENKNAIVRLYAFRALVNNLKEVPVEIVEKFRNDATLIEVKHGDVIEKKPLHSIASGFLY